MKFVIFSLLAVLMVGCTSSQQKSAPYVPTQNISVGTVQREIRMGMASADVISALGSPNMVTTDSQRREVWVYDRVSNVQQYSSTQGGISLIFAGVGGAKATATSSQRTLTIVVKFDAHGRVRDYSYRQSAF